MQSGTLSVAAATAALATAGGYALGVSRAGDPAPADPARAAVASDRGPFESYLGSAAPLPLPAAVPARKLRRKTVVVHPPPRPAARPAARVVATAAAARTSPSGTTHESDDKGESD